MGKNLKTNKRKKNRCSEKIENTLYAKQWVVL